MLRNDRGALRFVVTKPRLGLVQRVELVEPVECRVGHDPDAGGAGGKSNEPDPIPFAHEVVGGHRAVAFDQPPLPARVVAPLADVELRCDAKPRSVAVVPVGLLELQLPGQHPVAARRVDHPPGRRLRDSVAVLDGHRMRTILGPEFDRTHTAAGDVDAFGQAASVELVLQPAPVDLVGHLWHERGASELHPLRDIGVPFV